MFIERAFPTGPVPVGECEPSRQVASPCKPAATMRRLQLKTAARETPDRPAVEAALTPWVELVQLVRKKPVNPQMTIREFVRAIAGLGGHLGRSSDGEPGWITRGRGFEKLMLIARGAPHIEKDVGHSKKDCRLLAAHLYFPRSLTNLSTPRPRKLETRRRA